MIPICLKDEVVLIGVQLFLFKICREVISLERGRKRKLEIGSHLLRYWKSKFTIEMG